MTKKKTKVSEIAEKLKDKIEKSNIMNLKYLEQNFYMQKEIKLLEKKEKEMSSKSKKPDSKKDL